MATPRYSSFLQIILLSIVARFVSFPAYANYGGGTGEPNDPYQIASAEDLMLLGESPEDYDKHFILTADIDLDPNLPGRTVFDRAVIAPDTDFTSNGFQGAVFTGVFDGNNHKILRLKIAGREFLGLFGQVGPEAEISNLGLQTIDIRSLGDIVGGLAGWNDGSITLSDSIGTVNGRRMVGGLVGYSRGHITVSSSTGTIEGNESVGGLVGYSRGNITTSHSTGTIEGSESVGGLAGYSQGNVTASYSTGKVTGNEYVGGLVGLSNWQGSITMSFSTNAVVGKKCVGGLVGHNSCGIGTSYSTGKVTGVEFVGGLLGLNAGSITNSYSTAQ